VDAGILEKLRRICLALPDTAEALSWGHPNFRVRNKIFCSIGDYKGVCSISFKVGKVIQGVLPRGSPVFQDPLCRPTWMGVAARGWQAELERGQGSG